MQTRHGASPLAHAHSQEWFSEPQWLQKTFQQCRQDPSHAQERKKHWGCCSSVAAVSWSHRHAAAWMLHHTSLDARLLRAERAAEQTAAPSCYTSRAAITVMPSYSAVSLPLPTTPPPSCSAYLETPFYQHYIA